MRRLWLILGFVIGGAGTAAAQAPCPSDFQNRTEALACTCSAEASAGGSVWGSSPYTSDSRVCRAAVHAGAIPATGGLIHVFPAPGEARYRGSIAHGVTSADYGAWGASFTVAAPGGKGPAESLAACPDTFQNLGGPITCACTAQAAAGGSVWGSGVYTSDSRICRAAVHAGAIPATGGAVTVTPAPGRQAYEGRAANGVTSSRYGPWSASFTVAAAGVARTAQADGPPACPASFQGQAAPLSCTCTAEASATGSVWGTGVYTSDSRICRAAVHAGIIQATGGVVGVVPVPGLPGYVGTAANGVTSSNYGAWGSSFTFRR